MYLFSRLCNTLPCSILFFLTYSVSAGLLSQEDFSFTGPLTSNGWTAHSAAGSKTILSDGNAATLRHGAGAGEDVNRTFTPRSANDKTYVLFHVDVLSTPSISNGDLDANGLYFAHFKDATTNFPGRVFITNPVAGGDFSFGIEANDSSVDKVWASDFSFDTTQIVVMAYDGNTGKAELWINPTNEGSTRLVTANASTGQLVESFALRQSSDYTGDMLIDNIAVGTDFNSVFFVWDGSTGDWDDDARWLGGVEPTINDDVTINSGTVSVTLAGETAKSITLNGGMLIVDGGNLQTPGGGLDGLFLSSNMTIQNSGSVSTDRVRVSGASTLLITGPSSQLFADRAIHVGENTPGNLTVDAGATVLFNDPLDQTSIKIAANPGTDGSTMTLRGTNTTLNSNGAPLDVGFSGEGHLLIEDGAVAITAEGVIANQPTTLTSTATITGIGSRWDITGSNQRLVVGDEAQGMVSIANGGIITVSGDGNIAESAGSSNSQITITGAGSRLDVTGITRVGFNSTGFLLIENGGMATSTGGIVTIADQPGSNGSTATIRGANSLWDLTGQRLNVGDDDVGFMVIENGGRVETDFGVIGDDPGGSGSQVTVTGTASRWNLATQLNVGDNGAGSISIESGGMVDVAGITVIGNAGSGDATVRGAGSLLAAADLLTVGWSAPGILRIEQAGVVNTNSLQTHSLVIGRAPGSDGSSVYVQDAGSLLDANGFELSIGNHTDGNLFIQNGGEVKSGTTTIGVFAGSAGSNATIDGMGSMWNVAGDLTVGNGATGSLDVVQSGELVVAGNLQVSIGVANFDALADVQLGSLTVRPSTSNSGGITISGGATVSTGGSVVIDSTNTLSAGEVTVIGAGSSLDVGSTLTVGAPGATGMQGNLEILGGASLTVSKQLIIEDGIVTLSGSDSTLTVERLIRDSPEEYFDWSSGTLEITSTHFGITIDESQDNPLNNKSSGASNGQAPDDPGIPGNQADRLILSDNQRNLIVNRKTTIDGDKGLTISGGLLRTASVELIDGTMNTTPPLIFNSGTLELTESGITIGNQGLLNENETTISYGKHLIVSGETVVDSGATLTLGPEIIFIVPDFGSFTSGGLALMPGATVKYNGLTSVSTGRLTAGVLSRIELASSISLVLGDLNAPDGFYSNGRVVVPGVASLTLEDANTAVFDSAALVTIGDEIVPGTINAVNGITLDFGGNIVGYGTIDTPNDPFKPLTNNGNIIGNSPSNPITLTGYVKGVGTLDNVVITGTDSPGFSPATVYRGSVSYAGNLEVEIGGTSVGDFDKIVHSGTATLGGILDVLLINGFTPSAGDSFDILDWTTVAGNFSTLNLPLLGDSLDWDTSGLLIDGTISVIFAPVVGDLDGDGFVGITDLNIVLGNWNQVVAAGDQLSGDPSGDGFVGIEDLNTVLGNWNFGTPPNDSANIPEPTAFIPLGLSSGWVLYTRYRN
ncbi:MAG: hypothetical protein D6698_13530 [Gammaproteobacteria bacterium]|nr:MAG: hypothetical protein D6698_13530 [Gammaproteobacteria bacterium]